MLATRYDDKTTSQRYWLTLCLCLLLALGQLFTSWLSHQAMSKLSATLPAHIELLCTGTSMKFVSLPETLAQGKLVFVDPPLETQQTADAWCDGANAICKQQDALSQENLETLHLTQRYLALLQRRLQRPYTAFAYRSPQPRSPPSFLV